MKKKEVKLIQEAYLGKEYIPGKRMCIGDIKPVVLEREKNGKSAELISLMGICQECGKSGFVFYLES